MYITAQGCRLRNYLYCVEWDVKLYYTIPLRARCPSCHPTNSVRALKEKLSLSLSVVKIPLKNSWMQIVIQISTEIRRFVASIETSCPLKNLIRIC